MLKRIAVIAALVSLPMAGFASESKEQGSGPNPYSECGIGAAIFQDIGWAAAISNVIWDLGLTAITSALSSPETCNARQTETAILILETLPGLEQDLAVGAGEHLAVLGHTVTCETQQQEQFNAELRTQYASVVADAGYAAKTRLEKAELMYGQVRDTANGLCAAQL